MQKTSEIGESDFQVLKPLGQGTYGQVLMAREMKTGDIVALKLMKDRTKLEAFIDELRVSTCLSCYEGIIFTYPSFRNSMEHHILSQELAPAGSLHSLIQDGVGIPEVMVKRCASQLIGALEYMHSRGLVHRDVKPDKVLLMDNECNHIKLSDFGLTQGIGSLVPSMAPIIPYMAPELCELKLRDSIILDPSVDIWALGVLLYTVFTGYLPWERAMHNELFQRFVHWQRDLDCVPPPSNCTEFNQNALHFFHILLSQDPRTRTLSTALLSHIDLPWGVEEILEIVIQEEDVEMGHYVNEVIIIEEEDHYIVVENHGDIECIIVADTTDESLSSSTESTLLHWPNDTNLCLGSEVEII
ncbi:serine/threonine-protein kinase SBK1-like [Eleutherodactylus coqui]|uniref:serine/threonine-protein kinase SBK1-like n=1 Tax=Eleutherodactylus coqui TaxID=57060 RepID=UPI0034626E04